MSDVNTGEYIAATLSAILNGYPKSAIEELMPWRFDQPTSLAVYGNAIALTKVRIRMRLLITAARKRKHTVSKYD